MSDEVHDLSVQGQRVNEVLADYLRAVDADQAPSRQELLDRHPDLAAELQAFFADHDELNQFGGAARAAKESKEPTGSPAGEATLAQGETAAPDMGTRLRYFGDYELLEEIAR